MRAQVRSLLSHEVEAGQPEDPLNADVLVQVFDGPADGPGEEQFQVEVVTPRDPSGAAEQERVPRVAAALPEAERAGVPPASFRASNIRTASIDEDDPLPNPDGAGQAASSGSGMRISVPWGR
jgi:hypothetical protein